MLDVDLRGPGKWELIYSSKLVPPPGGKSIDPVDLPFVAESRFLIIGATCISAKKTWNQAGYLTQVLDQIAVDDRIVYPGLISPPANIADADCKLIPLNALKLVEFSSFSPQFRLHFRILPWIKSLSLAVWQFTGTESDTILEQVELARVDLLRVESKVDRLKTT